MDKQAHISYWANSSADSWDTAIFNLQGHQKLATLFFFHLAIEKLLKAIWIKDNISNTPPFTYDLQKLFSECELEDNMHWYDYLAIINSWNIEARYPDYKNTLFKLASPEYLVQHFSKINELKICLQEKL
jgi:HEPN domain-containing protein